MLLLSLQKNAGRASKELANSLRAPFLLGDAKCGEVHRDGDVCLHGEGRAGAGRTGGGQGRVQGENETTKVRVSAWIPC